MDNNDNREYQRKFKEKMYNAGFKQKIIWVERKEPKRAPKINMSKFISKVKKLTSNWDEEKRSELFNLLIKITKAKKEVIKLKEKP